MKRMYRHTIARILNNTNDVLRKSEFLVIAAYVIFTGLPPQQRMPVILTSRKDKPFPCIHVNEGLLRRALAKEGITNPHIVGIGYYFVAVPQRGGAKARYSRAGQLLAYCEAHL